MRIGMVFEGGGMRGLYSAGVLDSLMAAQIPVDEIVAVSAGALFGVNYVSGQVELGVITNAILATNVT